MKGLILKDIVSLKKQFKIVSIGVLIGLFQSISFKDATLFTILPVLIAALFPMETIAYDEKSSWDKYALTMPLSRTDIVMNKYLLALLFNVLAFTIDTIFNLIMISAGMHANQIMTLSLTSAAILFTAIYLPLFFKYGSEKGRYIMLVIYFILFIIVCLIFKYNIMLLNQQTFKPLITLFPFAALFFYVVSLTASIAIYNKKDL